MVYNTQTGGGDVLWTGTGTGTPGSTQTPGQTTNTQGTQATTDTWDTYTDTGLPTDNSGNNTGFNFVSLNGQPVLNPPQDNLSYQPTSLVFPQSLTNPTNGDPSQADLTYNSSFMTELATLAPELGTPPDGLSQDEINQIVFAFNNPGAPGIPPNIQNLVQVLSQNALADTQQLLGLPDWTPSSPPVTNSFFNKQLGSAFNQAFMQALNQYASANGLSHEQVAELVLAHYHPELFNPDSPTMKLLQKLNNDASQDIAEQYGLPEGYTPPTNSEEFDQQLTSNCDASFLQSLKQYGQQNNLSQSQQNRIEYFYYNPDATPTDADDAALKAVAQNLGSQAQATTDTQADIPTSYQIKPDTPYYNAVTNANFCFQVNQQLNSYQPPLTDAQKQEVRDIISGQAPSPPEGFGLSGLEEREGLGGLFGGPDLGAIASSIKGSVEQDLGVPSTFIPDFTPAANPSISPGAAQFANTALNSATETLDAATTLVDQMPPGPVKESMINYLKAVKNAIANLQNFLYQLEMVDSDLSKNQEQVQTDKQNDMLSVQREQLNAQIKSEQQPAGKGGFLGFISKIFNSVFGKVLMCVIAYLVCGPAGAAVMIAMQTGLLNKAFNAVDKLISKVCQDLGLPPQAADIMEAVFNAAIMVVCIMECPIILMIDPTDLMNDSNCVALFAEGCGASSQTAQYIQMGFTAAIMVACAVAMIVAGFFTGGATDAAAVAEIGAAVAEVAVDVAVDTAEVVAELPTMIMEAASTIVDTASDVVDAVGNMVQDIAKAIAQFAKQLLEAPGETLSELGSNISDGLGQAAKSMQQGMQALKQFIQEGVEDLLQSAKDFFSDAAESISETAGNVVDYCANAGRAFTEVTNYLKDAISDCDTIQEEIQEIVRAIAKLMKQLDSLAGDVGDTADVGSDADEGAEGADQFQYSRQFIQQSKELFNAATDWLKSHIGQIVGLLQAASSIQSAVGDFQNAILDLQKAKMALLEANLQAFTTGANAFLKLVEQNINNLMDLVQPIVDFINELSQFEANMVTQAGQVLTNLESSG